MPFPTNAIGSFDTMMVLKNSTIWRTTRTSSPTWRMIQAWLTRRIDSRRGCQSKRHHDARFQLNRDTIVNERSKQIEKKGEPLKRSTTISVLAIQCWLCQIATALPAADLLMLDNGTVKVGIDREKGAAITWLSFDTYPENLVNIADPGRLIQQSYYAGRRLDRRPEGQSKSWSPWTWNPIQGGGVGAGGRNGTWASVTAFENKDSTLYSETIPKLWDMPDENAEAVMRQWTTFEPNMPDVIRVQCEIQVMRRDDDPWGEARQSPQEVPACYFTRNFETVKSYLGDGQWRAEHQAPGPPWGKATPPLKAMAMFEPSGQGIAVFSPTSSEKWNFGPHGRGLSRDPEDGPCMHVAPIDRVRLGRQSTFRYRYWLVLGNEMQLAMRLDALWKTFSDEQSQLVEPSP